MANIERAINRRKCHECREIIAPGESHLRFYDHRWPHNPENMCQRCVILKLGEIRQKNRGFVRIRRGWDE